MAGEEEAVSTAPVSEHSEEELNDYFEPSPSEPDSESVEEGTPESTDEGASQADTPSEETVTEEGQEATGEEEGTPEAEPKASEPYRFAGREFESEEVAARTYAEAQTAMQQNKARAEALQEEVARYQAMLQGAIGGNPGAPSQPQAPPNPFAGMSAAAFVEGLEKDGYQFVAKATQEALLDSGLLLEVKRQAEEAAAERIWKQIDPLVGFITTLKVDHDLNGLRKDPNLAEVLPGMEEEVRARIAKEGNKESVKTIVDRLLAERFPSILGELKQYKNQLSAKAKASATASAATKGSGTIAPKAPAAKPKDELDDYFGEVATGEEDLPGLKLAR